MSGMDGGVRFTPRIPSQEPSFARSNNGWSPRGGADGADARCALSVPSTPLAFASMVGGSRPGRERPWHTIFWPSVWMVYGCPHSSFKGAGRPNGLQISREPRQYGCFGNFLLFLESSIHPLKKPQNHHSCGGCHARCSHGECWSIVGLSKRDARKAEHLAVRYGIYRTPVLA
jgi:hypothetical protein